MSPKKTITIDLLGSVNVSGDGRLIKPMLDIQTEGMPIEETCNTMVMAYQNLCMEYLNNNQHQKGSLLYTYHTHIFDAIEIIKKNLMSINPQQ